MKSLWILVAGTAALLFSTGAVAEVNDRTIHILAKDTVVLGKNGVKVPKLYVLSASGAVLFEGEATTDQRFEPVLAALGGRHEPAAGKPHAITRIVQDGGVPLIADGKPVLVSLEFGESVGTCGPCQSYYPRLRRQLLEKELDVLWVHVHMEKNDYVISAGR